MTEVANGTSQKKVTFSPTVMLRELKTQSPDDNLGWESDDEDDTTDSCVVESPYRASKISAPLTKQPTMANTPPPRTNMFTTIFRHMFGCSRNQIPSSQIQNNSPTASLELMPDCDSNWNTDDEDKEGQSRVNEDAHKPLQTGLGHPRTPRKKKIVRRQPKKTAAELLWEQSFTKSVSLQKRELTGKPWRIVSAYKPKKKGKPKMVVAEVAQATCATDTDDLDPLGTATTSKTDKDVLDDIGDRLGDKLNATVPTWSGDRGLLNARTKTVIPPKEDFCVCPLTSHLQQSNQDANSSAMYRLKSAHLTPPHNQSDSMEKISNIADVHGGTPPCWMVGGPSSTLCPHAPIAGAVQSLSPTGFTKVERDTLKLGGNLESGLEAKSKSVSIKTSLLQGSHATNQEHHHDNVVIETSAQVHRHGQWPPPHCTSAPVLMTQFPQPQPLTAQFTSNQSPIPITVQHSEPPSQNNSEEIDSTLNQQLNLNTWRSASEYLDTDPTSVTSPHGHVMIGKTELELLAQDPRLAEFLARNPRRDSTRLQNPPVDIFGFTEPQSLMHSPEVVTSANQLVNFNSRNVITDQTSPIDLGCEDSLSENDFNFAQYLKCPREQVNEDDQLSDSIFDPTDSGSALATDENDSDDIIKLKTMELVATYKNQKQCQAVEQDALFIASVETAVAAKAAAAQAPANSFCTAPAGLIDAKRAISMSDGLPIDSSNSQVDEKPYKLPDSPEIPVWNAENIFCFGGLTSNPGMAKSDASSRILIFDGTKWYSTGGMPQARYDAAACALGDKIYVTGGCIADNTRQTTKNCWIYRPLTGKWLIGPDMRACRRLHAMVSLGTRLFAIGGVAEDTILKSVEYYESKYGEWREAPSLICAVAATGTAVVEHKIYVCGGVIAMKNGIILKVTDAVQIFNFKKSSWTTNIDKPLPTRRAFGDLSKVRTNLYLGAGIDFQQGPRIIESVVTLDPMPNFWKHCIRLKRHRFKLRTIYREPYLYFIGGEKSFNGSACLFVEKLDCRNKQWVVGVEQLPYSLTSFCVA